jgi:hypothetical protein
MRLIAAAGWLSLATGALACDASQSGADACITAGGQCLVSSAIGTCARQGPPGCVPGGFCCLELVDAGDAMADAGDAGAATDAPAVCTPGQDQTCNDNPAISSIHGKCLPDGTCSCSVGPGLNPATGKCT